MSYTATNFYNDELSRLEAKQRNTDSILNSQERLAMLNDSYRKRYAKYVQILMVLVSAVALYLAINVLQKTFPAIPQVVVDIVTIVLMFLVILYLFSASFELYSRSMLNYDELDLPAYDASGVNVADLADNGQIFQFQGNTNAMCVGAECCPTGTGTTYNSSLDECVINATTPPTTIAPKTSGNGSASSVGFTTLEYENIRTAYTDLTFNSPSLKRAPTTQNVEPNKYVSVLAYSRF
jgi:hypothetical protein